jgi:hypothetical protein
MPDFEPTSIIAVGRHFAHEPKHVRRRRRRQVISRAAMLLLQSSEGANMSECSRRDCELRRYHVILGVPESQSNPGLVRFCCPTALL